jgi:hypothetical protein
MGARPDRFRVASRRDEPEPPRCGGVEDEGRQRVPDRGAPPGLAADGPVLRDGLGGRPLRGRKVRPGAQQGCRCMSPAAGRDDDLSQYVRQAQTVLPRGHRRGNRVSLILVRPLGYAFQAERRQPLPRPGRAARRTSSAVPASPRGSREDLDGIDIMRSQLGEQGSSLKDPGVVRACADMPLVGRPADTADCPGELAFTPASGLIDSVLLGRRWWG